MAAEIAEFMGKTDAELVGFLGTTNEHHQRLASAVLQYRTGLAVAKTARWTFWAAIGSLATAGATFLTVLLKC